MATDAAIQLQMADVLKRFGRTMRCKKLRIEHLIDSVNSIGKNPTRENVELVCNKFMPETNVKEN